MKLFAKIQEYFNTNGVPNSNQTPTPWGSSFDFDETGEKTIVDLKNAIRSVIGNKRDEIINDSILLRGNPTQDVDIVNRINLSGSILYTVTWNKK